MIRLRGQRARRDSGTVSPLSRMAARPASAACPSHRVPRGAPQTPRDAWAPPRHPAETPKPALRGRQRDQPRGQRARPTLRVASPLACPEPRATRKPARSVSGPAAAQPTPRHPAETPKTALRGRRRDRTRSQRARPALRVVSPATRPHATRKPAMTRSGPAGAQPPPRSPAETPKPALRGRQRDRLRGRRSRPAIRVASPVSRPKPRATQKPARSTSGPAAAQPPQRSPA